MAEKGVEEQVLAMERLLFSGATYAKNMTEKAKRGGI